MDEMPGVEHCYSYFPVFINEGEFGRNRDYVYEELKKINVYTRRYFYPLISQFPAYRGLESAAAGKMPVAEKVTEEVLCLPIYPDLNYSTIDSIIGKLKVFGSGS